MVLAYDPHSTTDDEAAIADGLRALSCRCLDFTRHMYIERTDLRRMDDRALRARAAALYAVLGVLGFNEEHSADTLAEMISEHIDQVEAERSSRRSRRD